MDLTTIDTQIIASLVINGDISRLDNTQRVQYVTSLCNRLGVDPLTQPFKILKLNGKEVLYADKGCAQQLCKVYGLSTEITKKEKIEDVYVVTVRAKDLQGRFTDEDGAVTVGSLKGDALANAMMKAVTKAKRRSVLAFCGLGMLDETEIETIKGAETAEIAPVKAMETRQEAPGEANAAKPIVANPEDEVITSEQGEALLKLLAKNGWTKEDLKEYIFFEFELTGITKICNKHLLKIKEYFSKQKPVEVVK